MEKTLSQLQELREEVKQLMNLIGNTTVKIKQPAAPGNTKDQINEIASRISDLSFLVGALLDYAVEEGAMK